ncbi:unnamed protein product, partial [Lepidochelys kempii]
GRPDGLITGSIEPTEESTSLTGTRRLEMFKPNHRLVKPVQHGHLAGERPQLVPC